MPPVASISLRRHRLVWVAPGRVAFLPALSRPKCRPTHTDQASIECKDEHHKRSEVRSALSLLLLARHCLTCAKGNTPARGANTLMAGWPRGRPRPPCGAGYASESTANAGTGTIGAAWRDQRLIGDRNDPGSQEQRRAQVKQGSSQPNLCRRDGHLAPPL